MTGVETALIIAAVAAAAVGAYGAIEQGNAQAMAARNNADLQDRNAEVARRNAAQAETIGEADAARQQQDARRRIASAANAAGASGLDPNSGTPLDIYADLAGEAAQDVELTRWRAREQSRALREQGAGFNLQAGIGRSAAGSYETAGQARAAGTILSSAGSIYGAAKPVL